MSFEEDGRPQTIAYFSQESDLPLTLGIVVDTSPSQRRVLEEERSASYKFLDQVLREDKDKAFVLHFEGEVELLQDLTSSRRLLEDALAELRVPEMERRGGSGSAGRQTGGGGYPGGGRRYAWWGIPGGWRLARRGTRKVSGGPFPGGGGGRPWAQATTRRSWRRRHGALRRGLPPSDELMRKQAGRKALVVLSDGVDNPARRCLECAIESAQRADTLVYSIYFYDAQAYGRGGFGMGGLRKTGRRDPSQEAHADGKRVLERLSRQTGGGCLRYPRNKRSRRFTPAFRKNFATSTVWVITPDRDVNAPGYRKIHVTTKAEGSRRSGSRRILRDAINSKDDRVLPPLAGSVCARNSGFLPGVYLRTLLVSQRSTSNCATGLRKVLGRQGLALGLLAEGQEQESDDKGESGQRDGRAKGLIVANSGADQKGEAGRREPSDVRGKGKGAGAALGAVLLGEPEGIDDEVGAADAQEESKQTKPSERARFHVEDLPERQSRWTASITA